MSEKVWTYSDLTNAAKLQIERCRKQAQEHFGKGDIEFAKLYAAWAYGVCELWHEQTKDHRPNEDREQLIELVKTVERTAQGIAQVA
jgi:hypothetical protein